MAKLLIAFFIPAILHLVACTRLEFQEGRDKSNIAATVTLQIIEPSTGEIILLTVNPSGNVKTVKLMLQEKVGIPAEAQHLHFEGGDADLVDDRTLNDFNIKSGSTLYLRVSRKSVRERICRVGIVVVYLCLGLSYNNNYPSRTNPGLNMEGESYITYILIRPDEKVEALRKMLEDEQPTLSSYPYELYRLDVNKTVLENERTLSYYGIQNYEILLIVKKSSNSDHVSSNPHLGTIQHPENSTLIQYNTTM